MAIIDVLKWDASPNVFAYKYPNVELNTKSQLIVSETQEAILLKEGKFVGIFGPGRHVLDTNNYPFLTSLLKLATKNSPFTAEVWFIQKSTKLDVRWGTSSPIQLEDPRYHLMLNVRAFGQYGIVISDSAKFLFKLVGTLPVFVERTIAEYFRGIIITRIKDIIAKYLIEKNISILHISANLNEISASINEQLAIILDDYGVEIVAFNINSISTDDNDPAVKQLKAALATKAEMDILGYNYQQKRSFDTLETAAGNAGAGGSVMNAGIGLGLGVGIGGHMGAMAGNLSENMNIANTSEVKTCAKCGTKNSNGGKFCSGCGESMIELCPECKNEIKKGEKFCAQCGYKLQKLCSNCNSEIAPNLNFCSNCGQKITKG